MRRGGDEEEDEVEDERGDEPGEDGDERADGRGGGGVGDGAASQVGQADGTIWEERIEVGPWTSQKCVRASWE